MRHKNKAVFLIWIMIVQLIAPVPGLALSGGNKAPEFESFQPFGLDNMVDPATGDFSYNIPLMNIGFHGINLGYQAGITMDQEATMVGLGWNINSGMINRDLRGIPDDFKGDVILKEMSTKPYTTIGYTPGVEFEAFGFDGLDLGVNMGVYANSYDGIGFEFGISPNISVAKFGEGSLTAGLGLNASSDGGATLSPNLSYSTKNKEKAKTSEYMKFGLGTSINSRGGLKTMSLSASYTTAGKDRFSLGGSANYNFAKPSFVPEIEFPRSNFAFALGFTVGASVAPAYPETTVRGYMSRQAIKEKTLNVPAYGLLYHEECPSDGLQDFHRSKDIPQSDDVPNLAVPMLDFDQYSVSGPGISGVFALDRGDLGLVHDRTQKVYSTDNSFGLEAGPGSYGHIGGDIVSNSSSQETSVWSGSNNLNSVLDFKSQPYGDKNFEKAVFKRLDDLDIEIPDSGDMFSQIKGLHPVRADLQKQAALEYSVNGSVKSSYDNSSFDLSSKSGKKTKREKRTDNITYKTFEEASKVGFSRYLFNNIFTQLLSDGIAKNHHIAEIEVEGADGYTYIYGLPVYSLSQSETSFSLNSSTSNNILSKNTGLVNYTSVDNSVSNDNGYDHFFTKTELPAFVSSYLLTSIVSSDYQDLTGNGPTPDDYGNYVRFDYEKSSDFNWKSPTSEDGKTQASLAIGFLTKYDDDKGHIVNGLRQQYKPKTISDKTEIVEYTYYPAQMRTDGKGELLNIPVKVSSATPALKSITKYNLSDYGENGSNAKKLKSALFEYNFSLCKGIYNGDEGKLTLKKVYILNGESTKGRFSPYEFTYADFNPNYSPKAMNRFAGYQPRNPFASIDSIVSTVISTTEFPYLPQNNKILQDKFSSAWNLKNIKLPSGGQISIEYEADDYAYIQDKETMQMFKIKGLSDNLSSPLSMNLSGLYIHFDIEDDYTITKLSNSPSTDHKAILKKNYIRDIENKHLYFKVLGQLNDDNVYEFVPGWTQIENFGIINNGGGTFSGWIKLKEVCLNERKLYACTTKINPIRKALMQALRLNLPEFLYGTEEFNEEESDPSAIKNTILALSSVATQVQQFFVGVNNWMDGEGYASKIDLDKSFIRLYCPSKKKISGSHRVRTIIMKDDFHQMTNGVHSNGIYGKQFEYTKMIKDGLEDREISSGVAAYEPMIGGEENPFFQPVVYKEELLLAPDNTKYQEEPMMEDYFPSPQIVYSEVTTRDLYSPTNTETNLQIYENTGYSKAHYYTYKYYPIIAIQTSKIIGDPYRSPFKIEVLVTFTKEKLTCSQGYFILNPMMHGKPKASYTYNSSGQRISGQEQYYKQDSNGRLDYNINALTKSNGNIEIVPSRMGLDYDLFGATREFTSKMNTLGTTFNIDITNAGFPIPVPTGFPKFVDIEKRYRSIVLVKSARQHGILYKTVAINGQSEITTEHILWDAETGQPIVSKTTNEFEDPIYQISLPAHLAYEQMGLSYQNSGTVFNNLNAVNGLVSNNSAFFDAVAVGDQIIIGVNFDKVWVLRKDVNSVFLIDGNGLPVNYSNAFAKIMDSGFTNQGSASIASYITKVNPIVGDTLVIDVSKSIIDASVTTYKDHWQTFCAFEKVESNSCSCQYKENFMARILGAALATLKNHGANQNSGNNFPAKSIIDQVLKCSANGYVYTPSLSSGINIQIGEGSCSCEINLNFNPSLPSFENIAGYDFSQALNLAYSPNCDGKTAIIPEVIINYKPYGENQSGTSFSSTLTIQNTCVDIMHCEFTPSVNACYTNSGITNPFLRNIKNNWRPDRSYVFQTDRASTNDIQNDGTYATLANNYNKTFINFWQNGPSGLIPNTNQWTWTNQNTMVSPLGMEIEARDPLNRYSAELAGYNNTKVVAVAANAKYNEIAYYGAEIPLENGVDVYGVVQPFYIGSPSPNNSCRPKYHFQLINGKRIHYDKKTPNSGEYCLSFGNKSKILKFETRPELPQICNEDNDGPYEIQPCDCIPSFEPTIGKKYFISAWLNHSCLQDDMCDNPPYIQVTSGNQTFKINKYGPLIEGWRKVEGTFQIANGDSNGEISLEGYGQQIFLDDIRIHPFHASMKTYNYDLKTLRFTFEHDDNNFFTRYDYADDGTLQRISKQTERGIQTLQESTFSQQKDY